MEPYDIERAFEEIEDELIESMIRNMKRHRIEEIAEDKEWTMWQAEQLKALARYRKQNKKKFGKRFNKINNTIENIIKNARKQGRMEQEIEILEAIKNGFKGAKRSKESVVGEFFKLNSRKLDALIKATQKDFQRGEKAILRMAEDQYRQIIFNAQVFANTGAGTYEQAVDMATKDFLSRGINCIEYKNGARHTMKDYADMAIRTAAKRAYLAGEGEKRMEWGISTVIVNKRGNACPKCVPFVGKVLIDDVYSGGSKKDGDYPLLSRAMELGLYHPRCKDAHTTYFPGVSTADDKWTKKELEAIGEEYKQEQKQMYAQRQAERFGRMEKHSLDEDNKKKYGRKARFWDDAKHRMDIFTEHSPKTLSQLDEPHKSNIIDMLGNAEQKVQSITLKHMNDIVFIHEKALSGAVSTARGIRVNLARDISDVRGTYTATFHEMGHRIDGAAGGLSIRNADFKNALISDFENVVNVYKKSYNLTTEQAYKEMSRVLRDDKLHSVSDIIGGITNNKCVGKYSHKTEYWQKPNKLEKEAFAHFYEAYARNDIDKITALSQMFSSANDIFLKLLEK